MTAYFNKVLFFFLALVFVFQTSAHADKLYLINKGIGSVTRIETETGKISDQKLVLSDRKGEFGKSLQGWSILKDFVYDGKIILITYKYAVLVDPASLKILRKIPLNTEKSESVINTERDVHLLNNAVIFTYRDMFYHLDLNTFTFEKSDIKKSSFEHTGNNKYYKHSKSDVLVIETTVMSQNPESTEQDLTFKHYVSAFQYVGGKFTKIIKQQPLQQSPLESGISIGRISAMAISKAIDKGVKLKPASVKKYLLPLANREQPESGSYYNAKEGESLLQNNKIFQVTAMPYNIRGGFDEESFYGENFNFTVKDTKSDSTENIYLGKATDAIYDSDLVNGFYHLLRVPNLSGKHN